MSQYNKYAQRLSTAFVEARTEYLEAWNVLQSAKKAERDAQAWRAESYRGENELRRSRAKARALEAEAEFKATERRVWQEFDDKKSAIRHDLERDVRASSTVDPDAIDANAMSLLASGILSADDYYSLVNKFDSNITMLRLIAKYAKDAAAEAETNRDDRTRMALNVLCSEIGKGKNKTMRAFDDLVQISSYCSGRGGGGTQRTTPAHTVAMAGKWEELSGNAVENF